MTPYWLLFLVFALGALWTASNTMQVQQSKHADSTLTARPKISGASNRFLAIALIATTLLIGFRYQVGTDWVNYERIFANIARHNYQASFGLSEPAYATINWVSSQLGAQIWLVNLVCAAIFLFGLARFAKAQPNPWLAIAVSVPYLIIVVGMGYTRQAVAIGLGMAGLAALSKGSFPRFVLWVMAAMLFHRTAIILIPLAAIAFSRNRLQTTVLSLLGCALGYYVLLRGDWLDGYSRYYLSHTMDSQGAGIRLGMNLIPAAIFLLQSRNFAADEVERKLWRGFALIAVAAFVTLMFTNATTLLDRLGLYIIPLQILVLSRIPAAFAQKGRQSVVVVGAVLLYSAAVQLVWFTFASNARNWLPYQLYPGLL